MKEIGILLVLAGAACFLLPLFKVEIALIMRLGDTRTLASLVMVLVGSGVFFFSAND